MQTTQEPSFLASEFPKSRPCLSAENVEVRAMSQRGPPALETGWTSKLWKRQARSNRESWGAGGPEPPLQSELSKWLWRPKTEAQDVMRAEVPPAQEPGTWPFLGADPQPEPRPLQVPRELSPQRGRCSAMPPRHPWQHRCSTDQGAGGSEHNVVIRNEGGPSRTLQGGDKSRDHTQGKPGDDDVGV